MSRPDDNEHLRDLEQCVIGAVLIGDGVLDLLPTLDGDDFHDLRAKSVWGAIRTLQGEGRPIDVATLEAELARRGHLDAVRLTYLGECAARVPTAENAVEYARLIRDASLARKVRIALADVLERVKRDRLGGNDALSMALAAISHLDAEQPDESCSIGQWVKQRIRELEQVAADRLAGKKALTGFPTGVAALDERIGGWQPGIASIIAARPGMGKSSLALATADACSHAGFGVHVFSLEDSRRSYADRSLSRRSRVPAEDMRAGTLNRQQLADLSPAIGDLHRRRGWEVDDRSGITADEIVRSVRRKRRANATRVAIVDYIQLCRWPAGIKTAHEALTHAISAFAVAAKQDDMAYVVLSQLNRGVESRADKRPQLSDLRESGSLEEQCKCAVGLYRGAYYGGDPREGIDYTPEMGRPTEQEWEGQVQLIAMKNSNGQTGRVWARWHGPTTSIW